MEVKNSTSSNSSNISLLASVSAKQDRDEDRNSARWHKSDGQSLRALGGAERGRQFSGRGAEERNHQLSGGSSTPGSASSASTPRPELEEVPPLHSHRLSTAGPQRAAGRVSSLVVSPPQHIMSGSASSSFNRMRGNGATLCRCA